MAEHTPTPWFKNRKLEIGPRPRTDDQHDGMLHPVADVFGDNGEANAAFIVKAVNEHADAEAALLVLCTNHGFATGHGDTLPDIIREIDGQIRTRNSVGSVGSGDK